MSLKRIALLVTTMLVVLSASLALSTPVSARTAAPPTTDQLIESLVKAEDAKAAYNALTAEQKAAVDAALKQYLDNLPSQSLNSDDPVGTQDVYGPFGTWGSCQTSGVAGVLAGLWSYYECWKDAYGLWWLATL